MPPDFFGYAAFIFHLYHNHNTPLDVRYSGRERKEGRKQGIRNKEGRKKDGRKEGRRKEGRKHDVSSGKLHI